MAQIRQLLTATCILPLGSPYVKAHAPRLTSLLLYGPRGTGKTALAKAIAYETGALWMDLSPSIIESHLGNKAEVGKLSMLTKPVLSPFAWPSVHMTSLS